jgi:hypothetical protein
MPMQNQGTPDVCNTRKLIDSDISGYENDLHARRDIRQGRRNTGKSSTASRIVRCRDDRHLRPSPEMLD